MNTIVDRLHKKHLEWTDDPDNDPPTHIVMNVTDFSEFQKYLDELERNESMPLTWLRNIDVIVSKSCTEVKVGRLV